MGNSEIHSTTEKAIAFLYAPLTGSQGVTVGLIVDSTGFEALEFTMEGGIISLGEPGAEYVMELEDGDDGVIWSPVEPDFLVAENIIITQSNQTISAGYIGKKRFVRPSIFRGGAPLLATIDSIGISVIGAKAHHIPSAPPAII